MNRGHIDIRIIKWSILDVVLDKARYACCNVNLRRFGATGREDGGSCGQRSDFPHSWASLISSLKGRLCPLFRKFGMLRRAAVTERSALNMSYGDSSTGRKNESTGAYQNPERRVESISINDVMPFFGASSLLGPLPTLTRIRSWTRR